MLEHTTKKYYMIDDNIDDSFDIYCPKCDNILEIAKSLPRISVKLSEVTPITISSDDNEPVRNHVDYDAFLKKIETGEMPTNEELESIDMHDLVKNEYYKKMTKKGEIKKKIINMIDDLENSDDNIKGVMICKRCGFNREIKPGFRIYSKDNDEKKSRHDCADDANYRNKVHIRTMPCTRRFKCPNKNCLSVKKQTASEAIFFRKPHTYETIYVCKTCKTIKRI